MLTGKNLRTLPAPDPAEKKPGIYFTKVKGDSFLEIVIKDRTIITNARDAFRKYIKKYGFDYDVTFRQWTERMRNI